MIKYRLSEKKTDLVKYQGEKLVNYASRINSYAEKIRFQREKLVNYANRLNANADTIQKKMIKFMNKTRNI